jgi:Tfp pilus assembly protein PilF
MTNLFAVPIAAAGLALALGPSITYAQGGKMSDSEVSFNAGLTHLRENRPALALEQFRKAIREDPKNAYAYKGLGITYTQLAIQCASNDQGCRQGRLNEAIAALRKALELNPYYVDVRNDLGTALVLSGKRAEGKAEFLAAFNDPTNPTAEISARNLGQAYFEEKNYREAVNWFRTSYTRNKSYPDPYLGFADAVGALGHPDEAVGPLEAALKEVPGQPFLLVALGEAYYKTGRFTEAKSRLEEALRRDPSGPAGRHATELIKTFPK